MVRHLIRSLEFKDYIKKKSESYKRKKFYTLDVITHYGNQCSNCGEKKIYNLVLVIKTMYLHFDKVEYNKGEYDNNIVDYDQVKDWNYPPYYKILCKKCNLYNN